jgi:hypothetical protein
MQQKPILLSSIFNIKSPEFDVEWKKERLLNLNILMKFFPKKINDFYTKVFFFGVF